MSETSWEVVHESVGTSLEVGFVAHHVPDGLHQLRLVAPELLVVEARHEFLTDVLVSSADQLGVQVAALITSPAGEVVADERGVGHRIRQPVDLAELAGRASRTASHGGGLGEGLVIALWGAQGSPGRTTMALTLASVLAHLGVEPLVIDADPRGGTIAPMLGLLDEVPGFLACCRLATKGELDESHLRRVRSVYLGPLSQFHVLTGVARMTQEWETPRDSVDQVIALSRKMYPVVIIDTGSDLVAKDPPPGVTPRDHALMTSHLLGCAEQIIAVIDASPVGIARFARAHLDFEALTHHASTRFWLNGVDSSRKALKDEAVLREALWRYTGVETFTAIPRDDTHLRSATMAACTVADRGIRHPLVASLRGDIAELHQLAASRRNRHSPPEHSSEQPPAREQGPLQWGVERWRKLIALR